MNELIERIRRDGKNLGNGILKVDGFINHQVDPALMEACGRELATRFAQLTVAQCPCQGISRLLSGESGEAYRRDPLIYE